MPNTVELLYKAPEPTFDNPHAQIKWIFGQLESEHVEPYAASVRWAKNTYIKFVTETNASYAELKKDKRFYLSRYWQHDALINFNEWLVSRDDITSKTRYGAHKIVRQVMHLAYGLSLPPKNESLAERLNSCKEKQEDEQDKAGAIHARIQAGSGSA
ncbi:hypothetical protein, partial [Burkholderia pseudomallei]|uniref:hypothetical protein n=1 Tax=Burkholderia pseudomallei TaxID=28450 RepID=UPI0011C24212